MMGAGSGVLFGLMLFFTAYFGMIFMVFPLTPLILVGPKLFRTVSSQLVGFWISNTVGLLEVFYGIKIVISGDRIRQDESSLILMNHRTRLDWMFFFSCIWRQSSVVTEKIILKSPLKRIPGAGWAMQSACYIFVHRNWEQDQKTLRQFVDYFKDTKEKKQILLFPEGTDFTAHTKKRSDEFARKSGLEEYEYVLHPRTTGFTYMAQYMRKEEVLDAIYDVTLGYPQNLPQDEKAILKGDFPREIHFHLKRHQVQTLPITEDGLREWCNNKWKEKEEKLKLFYTKSRQFDKPVEYKDKRVLLYVSLIYWTVFTFVSFLLCFFVPVVRWYVIIATVAYLVGERLCGGLEFLQIHLHNRLWSHRLKSE